MNEALPEGVQFYLAACDSILQRGMQDGIGSLSAIERTVLRVYVFDCEQQMGGLTTFFYNTDSAPEVAAETALALESIGASGTAAIFRAAAALICRPTLQRVGNKWGDRLQQLDPDGQLDTLCNQIDRLAESVSDLLEVFVIRHRNELDRNG